MSAQQTFFFYDLETSGLDPRRHRIMQFAGQRTDMNLTPIGQPVNVMIALNDDVLPDPGAIMVTGITPQQTREEGYSEADFCKMVQTEICTPNTIVVGFNNIRFDDEFMRYSFYRNFYDPYEWCWSDGRSRWDILDVVRLTRALRPDGIKWPTDNKGQPTNRLELLAIANDIAHAKAHDALSDVEALIAVTKLIKTKQPQLYDYMLSIRDKKKVAELVSVDKPEAFVYASGRYNNDYLKTTLAYPLVESPRAGGGVLVYDLRVDPAPFLSLTAKQLADKLFAPPEERYKDDFSPVPVKELCLNKCPAVAPAGVLDSATQERLQISLKKSASYISALNKSPGFKAAIRDAFSNKPAYDKASDCDAQLYDGFINTRDKTKMAAVRAATRQELADFHPKFDDDRLARLFIRYKARNYPSSLSGDERAEWEEYRAARIRADLPDFAKQLQLLTTSPEAKAKQFLLEELQLWAESIDPLD